MSVLYPRFLEDPAEYDGAASLWQSEWSKMLRSTRPLAGWETPWLTSRFANGTPKRDGNPIFSAVNFRRRLGIRVIQDVRLDGDRGTPLDFWEDMFAADQPEQIRELIISCVLTAENLFDSLDMMAQWVSNGEVQYNVKNETPLFGGERSPLTGVVTFPAIRPRAIKQAHYEELVGL